MEKEIMICTKDGLYYATYWHNTIVCTAWMQSTCFIWNGLCLLRFMQSLFVCMLSKFVLRLNTLLPVQFCVKVHFQLKLSMWFMMLFSKLHIDIFNLWSISALEINCSACFNCIHEPCVKKLFKIERAFCNTFAFYLYHLLLDK